MQNYSESELKELLGSIGTNVNIHRSVVFFNPKNIHILSNVRIDCFCIFSAGKEGIHIQDFIHIGAGSYFFGNGGKIELKSFANISSRVSFFTSNDDYVDGYMSNPLIQERFKNILNGPITLDKHAIIGSGSIVLPNVEIGTGGSVGALSLVKKNVEPFTIVAGVPAKKKGERNKRLLELEKEFVATL